MSTEYSAPTLAEIEQGATQLLSDHGLHDWSFAWDRATVRAGCCKHSQQTITLSLPVFSHSAEARLDWQDTMLHEIAHALVGPGHGHDSVWRRQAIALGARGEQHHQYDTPGRPVTATCAGCGKVWNRAHMPRNGRIYWCRCTGHLPTSQRPVLAWSEPEREYSAVVLPQDIANFPGVYSSITRPQ